MSKYSALTEFLKSSQNKQHALSFKRIEEILGFKLPRSAYDYRPWWANSASGHAQSNAWKSVGWETSNVDLQNEVVTFTESFDDSKFESHSGVTKLTIEEAKSGLAANFNVGIDKVEIIIRG